MTTLKSIIRAIILLGLGSTAVYMFFAQPDDASATYGMDFWISKLIAIAAGSLLGILYPIFVNKDKWIYRFDEWIHRPDDSAEL